MKFADILQCVFSVLGVLALYVLNDLKKSVNDATASVSKLNSKVGIIIERTERHDKELDEIKEKQDNTRERIHQLANDINAIKARNYE